MKTFPQGHAMKLAAVCLGLGLLGILVFVLRGTGSDADGRAAGGMGAKGALREAKTSRDREDARAELRRAREALREDERLKDWWVEGTQENRIVAGLMAPFDAAELRRLAKEADVKDYDVAHSITTLLHRAAAERHPGFQDLLSRPELREEPMMDMALCAYDYAVNGSLAALERMRVYHLGAAGTSRGAFGGPAAWAWAYVDEWDVAKQALEAHAIGGDGNGEERYAFWITRRYLFPQNRDFPDDYDRFVRELSEAQHENEKRGDARKVEGWDLDR